MEGKTNTPPAIPRRNLFLSMLGMMLSIKEGLSLGPLGAMHFDPGFSPRAGVHRSQRKQRLRKRRANIYK